MHFWNELISKFPAALGLMTEIFALSLIPVVLMRRKEPSSTLAWILALVFLPALGALLFLLFGRDRVRWPAQRKRELDAFVRADVASAWGNTRGIGGTAPVGASDLEQDL